MFDTRYLRVTRLYDNPQRKLEELFEMCLEETQTKLEITDRSRFPDYQDFLEYLNEVFNEDMPVYKLSNFVDDLLVNFDTHEWIEEHLRESEHSQDWLDD